jgi:hypothetical protein
LDTISAAGHAKLYTIDFTHPDLFTNTADTALMFAFSDLPIGKPGFMDEAVKLMTGKVSIAGLTVIGDELDASEIAVLTTAGIKVARAPATVSDMLMFEAVMLTQQFVTDVIGGPAALAELQAVFAAAQKPIRVIPPAAPLDYVVFELLGAAG